MPQSAFEPARVRDEHAYGDVVRQTDSLEYVLGVGELRDHVGPHEAGYLDSLEPSRAEQLDQADLFRGGDDLWFVLKAVPGPDLSDLHAVG
jgi:hypothetical protein